MNDQPSIFAELKQLVTNYFEAQLQLYKIGAYEKIAKVTAVLFSSLTIVILCVLFVFFLGISGGFFFGTLFGSNALGFLFISAICFVLFLVILVFRKKLLENFIMDKVIEQLFEKENND